MNCFHLYLIIVFAISFVTTPRPKNIRIFNTEYKNGKLFYEFTVFKNETFGIQFERGRGTAYYWDHLNDSLSKEQKPIIFLNTSSYFWADDRVPQTEIIYDLFSNKTHIITINNWPIVGGSEEYYEIFKAVDMTNKNEPEYLHLIYTDGKEILKDVFINLWVCDEIYKDQCIDNDSMKCIFDHENKKCMSKALCDKVEIASELSCKNAVTSTPSLTKCIYEKSGEGSNIQEKCTIKKLCVNSLTEEECNSALTINPETSKCIFNIGENKCEIKEICELEDNPSLTKCDEILTSNPLKMICTFDSITNKCIVKEIILKTEFPSTEIIEEEINSEFFSDIEINSDEITEGEMYSETTHQYLSSNEISEEIKISDEQIICFYDYKIKKCEQFLCDRMEDESVICDKINDVNTNIKCVYDE